MLRRVTTAASLEDATAWDHMGKAASHRTSLPPLLLHFRLSEASAKGEWFGERFLNLSPFHCILPSQRHILCAKEELKLSAIQ